MPEVPDIVRITTKIVNANTAPGSVVSVSSSPSVDWTGGEILKISVVVNDERADLLRDEAPLNILTQLRDELTEAGEERFPIIDYATPAEITAEQKEIAADDDYPAGPTL